MKKKIVAMCATVAIAALAVGGTLAWFTDTAEQKNTFTVGNVDIKLDEATVDPNDGDERTEESQVFADKIMPGVDFAKDPKVTVLEGSEDCWVFLEIDLNKYVSLINLMGVDAYANNIGGLGEGGESYPGFAEFLTMLSQNNALRETVVNRWFTGIDHSKWEIMNAEEIGKIATAATTQANPSHLSIVLGHKAVMSAKDNVTFMTHFGMPETVTQSMLDGDDAYKLPNDQGEMVSKSNFNTDNADFKMTFTAYAIQKAEIDTLAKAYEELFPTPAP